MADSMETLSQKFESFDAVMQKILDKVTGLEAWRTTAGASMTTLLSKADDTAERLHWLEIAPPPSASHHSAAVRPPPPPPPPTAWVNPFDLNMASDVGTRLSASTALCRAQF